MKRDHAAIILLAVELSKARRTRNVRGAQEAEAHLVRLADLVAPAELAELEAVLVGAEKAGGAE